MALGSLDNTRFVLDVQGLDGLKRAAHRDPQAQLAAAARQFEALLLGRMLESMRDAGFDAGLIDNKRIRFYQSLCDQQRSQSLAGKGVGLAEMLIRQLSGDPPGDRAADRKPVIGAAVAARIDAIPRGTPRSLAQVPSIPGAPHTDTRTEARADARIDARTDSRVSAPPVSAADPDDAFVQRFAAAARLAEQRSGIPARLILAQAALESGWGRHEITANGTNSHNLFGIKAGAGWAGAVIDVTTHEYRAGERITVREPFRAYRSYGDAFADHARLIGSNPRYAAVRAANTPEQAARALQECGYATDPHYADKLIAIMAQLDGGRT